MEYVQVDLTIESKKFVKYIVISTFKIFASTNLRVLLFETARA